MSALISIRLAVEDDLSEYVLRRVLRERRVSYCVGPVYKHGGFGYLKKRASGFNNAAKASPFLLLTDLDEHLCPPALIASWIPGALHRDFLLRVAVREVEAWLLGDDQGFIRFLALQGTKRIHDPEALKDPKGTLLKLAARVRKRDVREALVRTDLRTGSLSQGPDYNGTLAEFVLDKWDIGCAIARCPSLARLCKALDRLEQNLGV